MQPSLLAAFTEGVPLDSIPLVAEADERHMRAMKQLKIDVADGGAC